MKGKINNHLQEKDSLGFWNFDLTLLQNEAKHDNYWCQMGDGIGYGFAWYLSLAD